VKFIRWLRQSLCERLTGALLDRLTHRVHIIEANGESYRLKDARKRYGKPEQRENRAAPGTPPRPSGSSGVPGAKRPDKPNP